MLNLNVWLGVFLLLVPNMTNAWDTKPSWDDIEDTLEKMRKDFKPSWDTKSSWDEMHEDFEVSAKRTVLIFVVVTILLFILFMIIVKCVRQRSLERRTAQVIQQTNGSMTSYPYPNAPPPSMGFPTYQQHQQQPTTYPNVSPPFMPQGLTPYPSAPQSQSQPPPAGFIFQEPQSAYPPPPPYSEVAPPNSTVKSYGTIEQPTPNAPPLEPK